jgi:hypothetical protein
VIAQEAKHLIALPVAVRLERASVNIVNDLLVIADKNN